MNTEWLLKALCKQWLWWSVCWYDGFTRDGRISIKFL